MSDFVSSEVEIDRIMVWIRFPCLRMEYYDENVLLALAAAVGKPIKVDTKTMEASRGKFARVCMEIALDQPVVGRFRFRERWFNVEYEGLRLLCKKCGIFGHHARDASPSPVTEVNQQSSKPDDGGKDATQDSGNPKAVDESPKNQGDPDM